MQKQQHLTAAALYGGQRARRSHSPGAHRRRPAPGGVHTQPAMGFITDFFAGVLAEQQPDPKKLQQAHGERLDQYKKEQAQE